MPSPASTTGDCPCSPSQANAMFAEAPQYIDEQIAERNIISPYYWRDMFPVRPVVDGAGFNFDKLRFYPDLGPQYDGFDGWRMVHNSRQASEAALCGEHDACATNFETISHGLETVSWSLMTRDLETQEICIKDIRTFFQYRELQNLIFKSLAQISNRMREQLNRNAAYGFATNHVGLPGLPTDKDPKALPNIPSGVEVGKLTYRLLMNTYHAHAAEAGEYAIANLDGMPMFGVIGTPETLHDMAYEDADIRKDLRYCTGTSCDLIKKYNFLDAIGPFVLMPDLEAPRYDRDADGNLSRVFPRLRNVPIQIGTRAITNPAYHTAEFERVLIMTRGLFSLRARRALTSVGGQTQFGPEPQLFEWEWYNVKSDKNRFQRYGKYQTTGEVGVEPGDFTDVISLIVKRRPAYSGIEYWPAEVCPNDEESCDQTLGNQGCPCPRIVGVNSTTSDTSLTFTFDSAPGVEAEDTVEIELLNGGSQSGTVSSVSTDGLRVEVDFGAEVCAEPGRYIGIVCGDTDYCSSEVLKTELGNILTNKITLVLKRPIKASGTDTITLFMNDGSTIDVPLVSPGAVPATLHYTVTLTFAEYYDAKGVASVCVPTATDASCPDCDASQLEDCTEDEES